MNIKILDIFVTFLYFIQFQNHGYNEIKYTSKISLKAARNFILNMCVFTCTNDY